MNIFNLCLFILIMVILIYSIVQNVNKLKKITFEPLMSELPDDFLQLEPALRKKALNFSWNIGAGVASSIPISSIGRGILGAFFDPFYTYFNSFYCNGYSKSCSQFYYSQ